MKKYQLTVSKLQKINGTVEVEAENPSEAFTLLAKKILSGELRAMLMSRGENKHEGLDFS